MCIRDSHQRFLFSGLDLFYLRADFFLHLFFQQIDVLAHFFFLGDSGPNLGEGPVPNPLQDDPADP